MEFWTIILRVRRLTRYALHKYLYKPKPKCKEVKVKVV